MLSKNQTSFTKLSAPGATMMQSTQQNWYLSHSVYVIWPSIACKTLKPFKTNKSQYANASRHKKRIEPCKSKAADSINSPNLSKVQAPLRGGGGGDSYCCGHCYRCWLITLCFLNLKGQNPSLCTGNQLFSCISNCHGGH